MITPTLFYAKYGIRGALILGAALLVLGFLLFVGIRNWFSQSKIERLTSQRDNALQQEARAKDQAASAGASADNTALTFKNNAITQAQLDAAMEKRNDEILEAINRNDANSNAIVVRNIERAVLEARAAQDRLRGAASDGDDTKPAK